MWEAESLHMNEGTATFHLILLNTTKHKTRKNKRSDDSHSRAKLKKKIMLATYLKYTRVTQSTLCLIFLMYVTVRLQWTRI